MTRYLFVVPVIVLASLWFALSPSNTKIRPSTLTITPNEVVLPTGTQMGTEQVKEIIKAIRETEKCNLLVFGLGHDSSYWHSITQGRVVFIEDNIQWFNKITRQYPYLNAYKYKYFTRGDTSFKNYTGLEYYPKKEHAND